MTSLHRRPLSSYALASILGNRVSEDDFVRPKIGERTLRAVDFSLINNWQCMSLRGPDVFIYRNSNVDVNNLVETSSDSLFSDSAASDIVIVIEAIPDRGDRGTF